MKKTLALILAAMMVAGTSAVAFAVEPSDVRVDTPVYVWDSDLGAYEKDTDGEVAYGDKIAFVLTNEDGNAVITDSDEVRNLKAYPEYKVGESLVADKPTVAYRKVNVPSYQKATKAVLKSAGDNTLSIDLGGSASTQTITLPAEFKVTADGKYDVDDLLAKLKEETANSSWVADIDAEDAAKVANSGKYEKKMETVAASKEYRYVIELSLKESTTTATKDFFGEMYIGRTSNSAKEATRKGKFNLTVKNTPANEEEGSDYFEVPGEENYVIDFDGTDICDIEFNSKNGNSYALFTVDASGQGKENVGFTVKFNSEIAAKYPEANLEFLNFTASPVFNRTGDLYIYADEDSFIYEVTADGLKEIKNAEYDESSEAWVLKTRYLKSYAISDVELDLSASSEASSSETSSSNPSTGGTTGTTEGNTNVKPNPNTGR